MSGGVEVMHMPPLTMNQAKDLARDGKKRPLERGTSSAVMRDAINGLERYEDKDDDYWQKRNEESLSKKSDKAALKQQQKAESNVLRSSTKHSMKTRSKVGQIVQPGKFGRDLHRHF